MTTKPLLWIASLLLVFPLYSQWSIIPNLNRVTALALQEDDLWIATPGGLIRRNLQANTQTVYDALTDNFPEVNIWDMGIAPDGSLWLGSSNNGLYHFVDGSFTAYPTLPFQVDPFGVRDIEIVPEEGSVWVATDQGLLRIQSGEWTIWNTFNSQLPTDELSVLATDAAQRIWIGTDRGLLLFDEGQIELFDPTNAPLPAYRVVELYAAPDTSLWIGMAENFNDPDNTGGLVHFTGSEWTVYSEDNIPELNNRDHIGSITPVANGGLVLGTKRTSFSGDFDFIEYRDTTWMPLLDTIFLELANTRSGVTYSPEYGLLMGSPENGLFRYDSVLVNQPLGVYPGVTAPSDMVFRQGELFISGDIGDESFSSIVSKLTRLSDGTWSVFDNIFTSQLLLTETDELILLKSRDLARFVAGASQPVPIQMELPSLVRRVVRAESPQRILWGGRTVQQRFYLQSIDLSSGAMIDRSANFPFTIPEETFISATVDGSGRIVVLSQAGIQGKFIHRREADGNWMEIDVPPAEISSVEELWTDPTGRIWLRDDSAFARLDTLGWTVLPLPFPSYLDRAFTFDAEGRLWIIQTDGIYRSTETDFIKIGSLPIASLSRATVITQAPDGRFWIGSDQGLFIYDPPLGTKADQPAARASSSPWRLFPNPARSVLHVATDEVVSDRNAHFYSIISAEGRIVVRGRLEIAPQILIPVATLPAGMYYLRISTAATIYRALPFFITP